MENDIKITPLNFSDSTHLTAFIDLINAYIEESNSDTKPLVGLKKMRMVDTLNNLKNNVLLLAIIDRELVGCINCYEMQSIVRATKYLLIHDLIVLNGARKEEIETKLLKHAKYMADQREYPILTMQSL